MKKSKFNFSVKQSFSRVLFALLALMIITQSCKKDDGTQEPEPEPIVDDSLSISGPEDGLAIYINGKNSMEITPVKLAKDPGTYNISVFSTSTKKLYAKEVEVVEGEATNVTLTDADVATREWKLLVVGYKSVTDGVNIYTYTENDINTIANMLFGELQALEPYSYNVMKWTKEVMFIDATVDLDGGYITPSIVNETVTGVEPGDYDLIVAAFADGSQWGNWDLPETNINALNAKASFVSVPFALASADIEAWCNDIATNPTVYFINTYLRTLTQEYYPSLGLNMPPDKENQSVVMWRAEQYGYEADPEGSWKPWYRDIIQGTVEGKYGIGAQALYGMSPRAYALSQIDK